MSVINLYDLQGGHADPKPVASCCKHVLQEVVASMYATASKCYACVWHAGVVDLLPTACKACLFLAQAFEHKDNLCSVELHILHLELLASVYLVIQFT